MSTKRALRPYIKPHFKLNLNTDANTGPGVEAVLQELCAFLSAAGFKRPPKVKKRKTAISADAKMQMERRSDDEAEVCSSPKKAEAKSTLAHLGMQSMFRQIEAAAKLAQKEEEKSTLEFPRLLVLLDARLCGASAVANIFALYALNSSVPFYVVPELCSTLSKCLNLKSCSAVTIHNQQEGPAASICETIRQQLKPIELAEKAKGATASAQMKAPTLSTPIGKIGKKKRKRSKKKNYFL